MTKILFLALLIVLPLARAWAQELDLGEIVDSAQQWATQNLDDDVLRRLQEVDPKKVESFLANAEQKFQGEYVIDLAQLRTAARLMLPLLEAHQETAAAALWLKSQLDGLNGAGELTVVLPSLKTNAETSIPTMANPPADNEREILIEKVSERPVPEAAKPYIQRLKPVFLQAKVPAELVWIAEVESSFNPDAKSPVGAAGLFQLMPATAERYGLTTTWPFDQRYQPEASAGAAAKYLFFLAERFKDWRLALAAYNSGEGTVQRLLDRNEVKTFDGIASQLPAETQMFVPKVEATLLRREGVKLDELRLPGSGFAEE